MRILGLDYGSKTVGVAVSDPLGLAGTHEIFLASRDALGNWTSEKAAEVNGMISELSCSSFGTGIAVSANYEENGQKKIDSAWSELSADEEALIIKAIDDHWDELNRLIDDVFAGKKIQIKKIK